MAQPVCLKADALRLGMDLGMTLIDTSETCGEGGSEQVLGATPAGRREQAYVVTKVYPHNADRHGLRRATTLDMR